MELKNKIMETLHYTSKSKIEIKNSYLSSKEKIKSLRSLMSKNKIGAYLIPRADCFQGEFISENDNRLKWITNFSGSAGLCIVTMKCIVLFVDGRYSIQAKIEAGDNFKIKSFGCLNIFYTILCFLYFFIIFFSCLFIGFHLSLINSSKASCRNSCIAFLNNNTILFLPCD